MDALSLECLWHHLEQDTKRFFPTTGRRKAFNSPPNLGHTSCLPVPESAPQGFLGSCENAASWEAGVPKEAGVILSWRSPEPWQGERKMLFSQKERWMLFRNPGLSSTAPAPRRELTFPALFTFFSFLPPCPPPLLGPLSFRLAERLCP